MGEKENSIHDAFTIANEISESQKLRLQIDRIRDEAERGRLDRLRRQADEELDKEREFVRKEEERIVREELEKRARLREELHLTPDGGRAMTREELERHVRADVKATCWADWQRHLEECRNTLFEPIRQALERVREWERAADHERSTPANAQREQEEPGNTLRQAWNEAAQRTRPWERSPTTRGRGR